jgi:hypothetical protein
MLLKKAILKMGVVFLKKNKNIKVFKRTEIANVDNRDESKQDKRARSFVQ